MPAPPPSPLLLASTNLPRPLPRPFYSLLRNARYPLHPLPTTAAGSVCPATPSRRSATSRPSFLDGLCVVEAIFDLDLQGSAILFLFGAVSESRVVSVAVPRACRWGRRRSCACPRTGGTSQRPGRARFCDHEPDTWHVMGAGT